MALDAASVQTAFVGREREFEVLDGLLRRAVELRAPQAVTLVGPQGIGKSRLVWEWLRRVRTQSTLAHTLRVSRGSAAPGSAGPGAPYQVFTRLLRDRFELPDGLDPVVARGRVRERVTEVYDDKRVLEVLHFLGYYLNLSWPDSPFIRAIGDEPREVGRIARTVLRRFFEMDAERAPVVLLFEDIHYASDQSLDLVHELCESFTGVPVVILSVARPELYARRPGWGEGNFDHLRSELGPLESGDSEKLLRHLLSKADSFPDELGEVARDLTNGNPFFLEQLVRVFLADGTIEVDRTQGPQGPTEHWHIDTSRIAEAHLPLTVEEAVHARIAALSPAERDILEKAATLGNVFWAGALLVMTRLRHELAAGREAPAGAAAQSAGQVAAGTLGSADGPRGWTHDDTAERLSEILQGLVDRDYVLRMPDSAVAGTEEYVFKHNLERDLIAQLTPASLSRRYHIIVAQWLESRLAERTEEQLEVLAHHYEEGDKKRRAAYCHILAADKARARFANEKAIYYYEKGLDLLDLDDHLAKMEALHNLGDVYALVGQPQAAVDKFSEMLRLAWLLDHKGKGGAAHGRLGRIARQLGDYDGAMSNLEAARELFELARDRRGVAAAQDDIGKVHWLKGDYDRALLFHKRGLSIRRELGDKRSIAVSLSNIGVVYQDSGNFKLALECFDEALRLRRDVGDRPGVVHSLSHMGTVHIDQGDPTQAERVFNEALTLSREVGDRLQEAYILASLGEASSMLGRLVEAEGRVRWAAQIAQELGDKSLLVDCKRNLAEVALRAGEYAQARAAASDALEQAEALGSKIKLAMALRALGEALYAAPFPDETGELTLRRRAQAVEHLERAARLFQELHNDVELAKAYRVLGEIHSEAGHADKARVCREVADEIAVRLASAGAAARRRVQPTVRAGEEAPAVMAAGGAGSAPTIDPDGDIDVELDLG
jgi:tetratricopeptide (TPR) repeat protein